MLRALGVKRKGDWDGVSVDHVVLKYDDRYRRRITMTGTGGLEFLLDLKNPTVLNDGDALILSDNQMIAVVAAAEPLIEVRCKNAEYLVRIAWHIGNRHTPCEIKQDCLVIRCDHVLEDLLIRLGAVLEKTKAPFNPEGGAYGVGRTHSHAH